MLRARFLEDTILDKTNDTVRRNKERDLDFELGVMLYYDGIVDILNPFYHDDLMENIDDYESDWIRFVELDKGSDKMEGNEELTLEYVRNYLRGDDYGEPEEDRFIKQMIRASKSFVETYLNRKLSDFEGGYPKKVWFSYINLMAQWYDSWTIMTPRSNVKEMNYTFKDLLDPHRFIKLVSR